jgi:hypothetical protein
MTSHDGHASRFTASITSLQIAHPALNTSILRLSAILHLDGRMHLGVHSKVKGGSSSCERCHVARESFPSIAGNDPALETDCADDEGPSVVVERNYLAAARIAQKLREAGFGCEIVGLVSTDIVMLRLTLSKH